MKNLSSWLIALFALMFWGFRVVVTVMYSMGSEFVTVPMDMTMEIVLLFVTFICICCIIKRLLLPAIIYLIAHVLYYGIYFYENIILLAGGAGSVSSYLSLLIALVGLAIPLAAVLDVLMDKSRKANPKDKQTDWFYKNKEFDRQLDERADKNNYRTL